MRSLFLRIFFWYWLVMALLGLALLAVTATTPSEGGGRRQARLEEVLSFHARTAAALQTGPNPQAASEYLAGMRRVARLRAWLFDEKNALVAGENAPPEASHLAARMLQGAKPGDAASDLQAQVVSAPDGRRFVLVGERVRPGAVDAVRYRLLSRRVRPEEQALRLAVVLLTAGVLCYVMARYLTVPVVALRDATRKLAAGDLSARVGATARRNDELAGLAQDFDVMAARLENLVLSQRRLIGDMSHELRSPLARLNVALELARMHDLKNARDALHTDLDRVERESARLNELIGQLLTLSHLESGETRARQKTFDLSALVHEIAADADFEARHRGRSVQFRQSDDCRVLGDRELLRRAIENVTRNAAFYTKENTAVEIALECSAAQAVIRVRDYGPGAPEGELAELFRPFHRIETARDRQSGGVGLGLAIAERAVRLHGGEIKAFNAPDGGLIVEISLPAGEAKMSDNRV